MVELNEVERTDRLKKMDQKKANLLQSHIDSVIEIYQQVAKQVPPDNVQFVFDRILKVHFSGVDFE